MRHESFTGLHMAVNASSSGMSVTASDTSTSAVFSSNILALASLQTCSRTFEIFSFVTSIVTVCDLSAA